MPYAEARSELTGLGLVAVLGGSAPLLPQCPSTNLVAQQDPVAGNEVEVGSIVTLYTGEEPPPTPTASAT